MILDTIANAHLYFDLGAGFKAALQFLSRAGVLDLEPPKIGTANSLRHAIQGDEVFALIQRYQTKSAAESFWEAHRRHIDVQFIVEGMEMMGWSNLQDMRIMKEYDTEKDCMVLEPCDPDQPLNFVRVPAGSFVIFMPHDAHMPGLAVDGRASNVKKIVVKVRV